MAKDKRVTVHVSRELHSKAKSRAALQGKSLSDVVRDFLESFTGAKPKRDTKRADKGGEPEHETTE